MNRALKRVVTMPSLAILTPEIEIEILWNDMWEDDDCTYPPTVEALRVQDVDTFEEKCSHFERGALRAWEIEYWTRRQLIVEHEGKWEKMLEKVRERYVKGRWGRGR